MRRAAKPPCLASAREHPGAGVRREVLKRADMRLGGVSARWRNQGRLGAGWLLLCDLLGGLIGAAIAVTVLLALQG